MDWGFLSDQSKMLIWCCLTSLCLQMTSGSEWKMRCLKSSGHWRVHLHVSSGHPVCTVQCSCCPRLSRPAWLGYTPSIFSPLTSGCQMPIPAWIKGTPLRVREHGHSHSISFCPCLHPVTALPSAACSRTSAEQWFTATALSHSFRSCHSRSYNIWSISCLVITVLKEYKLLWKITLK